MTDTADPPSFEQSLLDLERLVRELEDGRLGLEDALARYEQGVGLIKRCHQQLRDAEQRVLLLAGVAEDGQPLLQPFRHEATAAPAVRRPVPKRPEGRE